MTIERIDEARCTGCGICINSCPVDVIRLDDKTQKAVIKYPEDCMLCGWCKLDCPTNAIYISPAKVTQQLTGWG